MKWELPEGWEWVELKSLSKQPKKGFTDGDWILKKDLSTGDDVRLIQLADVGEGAFLDKSNKYISKERCTELKCTLLKPNDILLARLGEPLAKSIVFPRLEHDCITAVDVTIIRVDKIKVNVNFLKFFLNSTFFKSQVYQFSTGATRKRISRKNLEKLKIPLPPLATQKKIVAILEKAEELKRQREEADKLTGEFLQSVFLDMFGDPVTNPKGWEVRKLGDLILPTSNENPNNEYPDEEFFYIDISSIDAVAGDIVNVTNYLGKNAPSRARQKVKYLDLLVSTVRPNLNAVALVPKKLDSQICSTGFCVIRANNIDILPHYVYQLSRTPYFIKSLVMKCKGANYPAVSNKDVKGLDTPVPPLSLQKKFATIVEKVEPMKGEQEKAKEQIDDLFDALMQKAFKGELAT